VKAKDDVMKRYLSLVVSGIMTILAARPSLAQGYGGHGWGWHDAGWGHMIFGGFMMIVFWGGIIVLVVLLVRWLSGGHPQVEAFQRSKPPLQILQERFAKGEIDKEEYEERKRLLSD
jgi:putative membrane protein